MENKKYRKVGLKLLKFQDFRYENISRIKITYNIYLRKE